MSNNFDGTLRVSSWGSTKFIETSSAAVSPVRISQVVRFPQRVISIGWVSSYLSVVRADRSVDFSITMEVRERDSEGNPSTLLDSYSIPSSSLSGDGWYKFEFSVVDMANPENGLCFVYFQTGGDENNYASWGYNVGNGYSGAYESPDSGTTWTQVDEVHRVMRVAAYFDAYGDIVPYRRIASPSAERSVGESFIGGEYENTKLVTDDPPYYGYQQQGQQKIVLDTRDLHVSLVVDSSGSMGWRDRFGMRKAVAEEIVSRFKSSYPGNVTFDFVGFGGRPLDLLSISPLRRLVGAMVNIRDISFISGFDADGNHLLADDIKDHLGSGIVSYGFKNLKSGTQYANYGFNLGWSDETFSSAGVKWIDMWSVDSPLMSSAAVGPNGASSMTISLADSNKDTVRYVFGNDQTTSRKIPVSDLSSGDTTIDVDNDPAIFNNTSIVAVADRNGISVSRTVIDSTSSSITVSPQIRQSHTGVDGMVLENSSSNAFGRGWGQTDAIEFYFLDANQAGDVTFFVQTANGAHVEWDFTPIPSWEFIDLYYLDETAQIDVDVVDANGEPLPDGTTVEFYVDKKPEDDLDLDTENEQESILLTADALDGDSVIYVSTDDIGKFKRGDSIDIVDDNRKPQGLASGGTKEYHTTTISSIVEESGKIKIADAMPSDFLVADNASILLPSTSESKFDTNLKTELPISAGLVDVTPIYVGEKIPEIFRDELDPPQVDPSDGYDDNSADPTRVMSDSMELTTMNGYAAIRLLPVTEDRFLTDSTKNSLAKSMFDLTDRELVRQQALNDFEKGRLKDGIDDAVLDGDQQASAADEPKEPEYYDGDPDFIMDHKIVSVGGFASTDMTSFTNNLTFQTIGPSYNANDYMAKEYVISPVITMYDDKGEKAAIILSESFSLYFASPIFIKCSVDSTVTFYDCTDPDPEVLPYNNDVPGAYATDEKEITVSYIITDKTFPANGTMNVSIYDARRTPSTANVQDEDLGNVDGCGDSDSIEGIDNVSSTSDLNDEYTASLDNMLLADDILGDGFASRFTLEVVGGEASFSLPQIDRVALLEIHAEFEFDNGDRKIVNKQKVYYKSPVVLRLTGMGGATADGETKVNVGASVWWKEEGPVDDGTIVTFEADKSPMTPSVSETISGIADGVLVGPHEPIPPPATVGDLQDGLESGEDEGITAQTSYRGFSVSKSGTIRWGGAEAPAGNFYFYAKAQNTNPDPTSLSGDTMWADGYDYLTVNGDLPASSFRAFPFIDQVYQDLIDDNMGVVYSGSGLTAGTRLARWTDVRPTEGFSEVDDDVPYGWVSNRMYANIFVGRPTPPPKESDDADPCLSPQCRQISMFTKSRKNNAVGIGIDNETVTFPQTTPGGSPAEIPRPRAKLIEPLGITMSIEPVDRGEYQSAEWGAPPVGASPRSPSPGSGNHPVVRDGERRYWIIAEVTWRDGFIVGTASNPMPEVVFEPGTYQMDKDGNLEFLPLKDPSDIRLDSPDAVVSHLRTSASEGHYHEVRLDANGVGVTTATISHGETIYDDHVHAIDVNSDEIISENMFHTHGLRSVAIVGMAPVRNRTMNIAIRGTVTYDNGKILSTGNRVVRTLEDYALASPLGDGQENPIVDTGYKLEIISVNKQYIEGRVVDAFQTRRSISEPGYTILYKASIVQEDGSEIPVDNGTRIFTSYKFYEFNDDDAGTKSKGDLIVISKEDKPKNYAVLKIDAFFSDFPDEADAESEIIIASATRWFPSVAGSGYIRFPETDSVAIQSAIDSFYELGSSQLNDAVALAARRMIKFSDYIANSKKIIILLSDMTEGQSDISYDQAIEEVISVDASDRVEIFPVKVSEVDTYSDLVAEKYAFASGGQVISVTDINDILQSADDCVESIVQSPNFDATSGTYTNTVDLGNRRIFNSLSFNVSVPTGSGVSFRVRFSDDGVVYGRWISLGTSGDFDISSLAEFGRYMQYEISFSGNPDTFESPEFTGMEYEYYEPGSYTMFFRPIQIRDGADGYVGEIIFSHEGNIPSTSEVRYGISHSDSSDLVDFGWNHQPLMKDGFGGIILSRVNEPLVRNDSVNYAAPYGGWNRTYDVDVYRINSGHPKGILVDPSSYSVDSILGKIVFGQPQPSSDKFTVTVGLNSEFSIVVDMVNYGEDTLYLDYLGAMYRTVDRADIYSSGRKSVETAVDTDLGLVENSGTIQFRGVSFVSEIGSDSDSLKDVMLIDGIYYVLAHDMDSGGTYIATLNGNFTFIERFDVGSIGVPVSFGLIDDIWHISYLDGNAIMVLRTDSSFNAISVSDFGFIDEHPASIRSLVGRWYVPNGSSIQSFGRSFNLVESIPVGFELSSMLSVNSDGFMSISVKNDVIFIISLDGTVSKAYSLGIRASEFNNIREIDGSLFVVESSRILSGEIP